MLGANLGILLYGDISVMVRLSQITNINETQTLDYTHKQSSN